MNLGEKTVIFTCEASGTPPLHYSWEFNGQTILGKTENATTLTISNVDKKDAGKYLCIVRNRYHRVTSDPAELRIGTTPLGARHA